MPEARIYVVLWNGIDYNEYNPQTDQYIIRKYNADNFRKEKIKNKRTSRNSWDWKRNDKKMMIGIVSRLTDQKGMDLVAYIMDELCQDEMGSWWFLVQVKRKYENMFRHFDWKYHGKVFANIYYSEELVPL